MLSQSTFDIRDNGNTGNLCSSLNVFAQQCHLYCDFTRLKHKYERYLILQNRLNTSSLQRIRDTVVTANLAIANLFINKPTVRPSLIIWWSVWKLCWRGALAANSTNCSRHSRKRIIETRDLFGDFYLLKWTLQTKHSWQTIPLTIEREFRFPFLYFEFNLIVLLLQVIWLLQSS